MMNGRRMSTVTPSYAGWKRPCKCFPSDGSQGKVLVSKGKRRAISWAQGLLMGHTYIRAQGPEP